MKKPDIDWILGLPLDPGPKILLVAIWREASWLPQYGTDDFRATQASYRKLSEVLQTPRKTLEAWARSLRREGWIKTDTCSSGLVLAHPDPFVEAPPVSSGFIYVVRFSDGRIKVGRSANARARIKSHAAEARRNDTEVTAGWVSTRVEDMAEAEAALIAATSEMGGSLVSSTTEYFTGVDFDVIVRAATALTEGERL